MNYMKNGTLQKIKKLKNKIIFLKKKKNKLKFY